MTTVGKLAKQFGLSRSTLLYYHRIGLLCPTGHQEGAYRQYSAGDKNRLEQIVVLKSAGMPLNEIKLLLEKEGDANTLLLRGRLTEIASRIDALQRQQRITAMLLGMRLHGSGAETFSKVAWTRMLADAGFDEAEMHRWHNEFETQHPKKHSRFLASLGISKKEIAQIRKWSREI